jgi:hypothetical protein
MSQSPSQLILTAVNSRMQTSLRRLNTYLERVERDLTSDDRNQALANLAELAEIPRRLWNNLAKVTEQSDRG